MQTTVYLEALRNAVDDLEACSRELRTTEARAVVLRDRRDALRGLVLGVLRVSEGLEDDDLRRRAEMLTSDRVSDQKRRADKSDAVLEIFEEAPKRQFSVDEVASQLAKAKIPFGEKTLYNALNHLARQGKLQRIRPGVYRHGDGFAIHTSDELGVDPNQGMESDY